MDMVTADAMPGGAHPALADLNREMAFHYARRHGAFETPYMHEVGAQRAAFGEDSIVEQGFKTHLLTLRRIAAPCPYVGRTVQRFTWDVLVDEAGRCIADDKVYRVVDQSRAFIEGWQGADDELRP